MFKRVLAAVLASATVLAIAGCTSSSSSSSSSTASTSAPASGSSAGAPQGQGGKDYSKEIVVEAVKRTAEVTTIKQPLKDEMLKEKFNLVIEETPIAPSDYTTKMQLLFATNKAPDLIYSVRRDWGGDEWAASGYLRGFTKEELLERVPNYKNLWTEEGVFDYVFNFLKLGDDKIYSLPGARATKGNMSWCYRQDIFDSAGISEFPKTADELYETMKLLNEKTGKVPYVASSDVAIYAFTGICVMYGLPELLPQTPTFKNPVTGEIYYYACSSETYREVLKYMNKLYSEGLMWKEFATATTDQNNKFTGQGNKLLQWGYPAKLADYDNLQITNEPNTKWTWTDVMPTADPAKGTFFKRDPYHLADQFAFGQDISDEALDRLLDYANWALSDEGVDFLAYGKEGVTYEMKDGVPYYLENFATPLQAAGDKLGEYQIGSWLKTPDSYNKTYTPILAEWEEKVFGNPDYSYITAPVMSFTTEENKQSVDTLTNLNDARDEYTLRFIMGQLDPNKDEDWNSYISALEKLGLRDLESMYKTVYERSGNE